MTLPILFEIKDWVCPYSVKICNGVKWAKSGYNFPCENKEKMEGKKRKKIDSPYPCLRMKTDENGRETPSTISISIFCYEKQEREQNNREQERRRDIRVTEMGGNRKIYRNALLFNHHSPCMNITLYTLLRKLCFMFSMIKSWSTPIDVEEQERIYDVPIFF